MNINSANAFRISQWTKDIPVAVALMLSLLNMRNWPLFTNTFFVSPSGPWDNEPDNLAGPRVPLLRHRHVAPEDVLPEADRFLVHLQHLLPLRHHRLPPRHQQSSGVPQGQGCGPPWCPSRACDSEMVEHWAGFQNGSVCLRSRLPPLSDLILVIHPPAALSLGGA